MNIQLTPLQEHEKETFIRNIQIAFKKAVVEQFGPFDEEIIPLVPSRQKVRKATISF